MIYIQSDVHGSPQLYHDHRGVYCSNLGANCSAHDWYGYWKINAATLDFAFDRINSEFCLGSGYELRYLGTWSDGVPVVPAQVASDFGL